MALTLTSSNRFEALRDALFARLDARAPSPFTPDTVIVPSVGVRRRLELDGADRFGVFANVAFPFLAEWLWDQIARVVPGVESTSPFAPARLAWRVFRMLGDAGFPSAHPPLAAYLRDGDALMRYELAVRIATVFDHYVTYRRDWLDAWSAHRAIASLPGERTAAPAFVHEAWQADLWRRLASDLGTDRRHPSVAFLAAIRDGTAAARRAALPACAHVFCLPAIPPLYMQMLRELAQWMDLHVYLQNPSEAYWADIVSPRRAAELTVRRQLDHHEVGHALLAEWGVQTRAHLALAVEAWDGAIVDAGEYRGTFSGSLLGRIHASMLQLDDLLSGTLADVREEHASVAVHACHSRTRELEVLQDQLLGMFAADPSLRPGDILVATPRLQETAPLIDVVFANAPEARRIPYTITGRARTTANPAARALLLLLGVATSRFQASAVFEVVQQPMVARRLGIDAEDQDAIRRWIQAGGIRWGVDAEHRAELGLPPLARHTFADGLQRLFLGYALPTGSAAPVEGWLPAGDAEGSAALALGAFALLLRRLERSREELARPLDADLWLQALRRLIETYLDPGDEDLEDLRELESVLHRLHEDMAGAGDAVLSLEVVRAALEAALDDPARGGVPGGTVTFASMTSLRNVPFRVVCVIGLDDGVFPAQDRPLEFDLIAAAPRRGDRQRRDEDRNVFLDLVLAARERLYLSYTGRDIRDNSVKPPSAIVADLLDVLVPALAPADASPATLAAVRRALWTEHPLQPFSVTYFAPRTPEALRSFDEEYCAALRRRFTAGIDVGRATTIETGEDVEPLLREPARPFFQTMLSAPGEEWRVVTLARLSRFFRNPCRFLLQERLGLQLPEGEDELDDDEPFVADWAARNALAARLLPHLLAGESNASVHALATAGIEYPPGNFGEQLLAAELQALLTFAQDLAPDLAAAPLPPVAAVLSFEVGGAAWRVEGAFGDLRPRGRVRYRYDDVRATDYLEGWIEHLFLNAAGIAGVEPRTTWHSRDGRYVLPPLHDARAQFAVLLGHYAKGLAEPLRFFPKSSWCYVDKGIRQAEARWQGRPGVPGEGDHPAYRLCLRGIADPLDEAFTAIAEAVFGPLRAVIDDPRLAA